MAVVWLATSFNYYLIQFLLETFDEEYLASTASALSDVVAFATSGVLYVYLGTKLTLVLCHGSAAFGGLLILLFGLNH